MRIAPALLLVSACGFSVAGTTSDGPAPIDTIDPIDTGPSATCDDGVKNGGETGVDCGGSCPEHCDAMFTIDANTLAVFELNGDVLDTSGNHRDAALIGGTFVPTAWGQGLSVPGAATQGFQWNTYGALLVHPFTVEMVLTPAAVSCWRKLFGPDDTLDKGWNYCDKFHTYPGSTIGPNLTAGQRHYFAIVSTSSTTIDVYLNGTRLGGLDSSFTAPPAQAIFFRDDTQTGRAETLTGVIDAVRLSKVARTATEITMTQTRITTRN